MEGHILKVKSIFTAELHVRCEKERTVGDSNLQKSLKGSHSLGWGTRVLGKAFWRREVNEDFSLRYII